MDTFCRTERDYEDGPTELQDYLLAVRHVKLKTIERPSIVVPMKSVLSDDACLAYLVKPVSALHIFLLTAYESRYQWRKKLLLLLCTKCNNYFYIIHFRFEQFEICALVKA